MIESQAEPLCVYNAKLNGEEFVGIRFENGRPKVYFPLGCKPATNPKEERQSILDLISALSATKRETPTGNLAVSEGFPIKSYLGVLSYFLNFGYFVENEIQFQKSDCGKIHWKKTIQKIIPQIDGKSTIYLQFISQKNVSPSNAIITQIHRHCVFLCTRLLGQIFKIPQAERASTPFDKKLFLAVLREKSSQTFNARSLELFSQMRDIIQSLGKDGHPKDLFYGTENFEYVWQNLIDRAFGISDKQKYFPKCIWRFPQGHREKSQDIFPDTVMEFQGKIFILDAKYYRYGATKNTNHLPDSQSIVKQFAYAEFVENHFHIDDRNIFNVFLSPYDSNDKIWRDLPKRGRFRLLRFGEATGNWKEPFHKNYAKIHGILLDTALLLKHHPKNSTVEMEDLAKAVAT